MAEQLHTALYPGRIVSPPVENGAHCSAIVTCVGVCVCVRVRNLSSAGEEARSQLRCCEGLVDSLLHVLKVCVNTSDYDSKVRGRTHTHTHTLGQ